MISLHLTQLSIPPLSRTYRFPFRLTLPLKPAFHLYHCFHRYPFHSFNQQGRRGRFLIDEYIVTIHRQVVQGRNKFRYDMNMGMSGMGGWGARVSSWFEWTARDGIFGCGPFAFHRYYGRRSLVQVPLKLKSRIGRKRKNDVITMNELDGALIGAASTSITPASSNTNRTRVEEKSELARRRWNGERIREHSLPVVVLLRFFCIYNRFAIFAVVHRPLAPAVFYPVCALPIFPFDAWLVGIYPPRSFDWRTSWVRFTSNSNSSRDIWADVRETLLPALPGSDILVRLH